MGIIEFLNDFSPKTLVCKFAVPFIRVVLYQRMLIEQRNDIHLNTAKCLQHNEFSYMPYKDELRLLDMHLKITEKTIINYLEENDDEDVYKEGPHSENKQSFNLNNLKIYYVKDLCEKLKEIDLRVNAEGEEVSKNESLKSGILKKKADDYMTWEK